VEWDEVGMRGKDEVRGSLFSYVDLEQRIRPDHPLRMIRALVNRALADMSPEFDALYPPTGRDSIPPERLLRALLLQAFFSIRSERQLVERIDFDLLFRWFVGLGVDDRDCREFRVWSVMMGKKDVPHGQAKRTPDP
jgi:transposase